GLPDLPRVGVRVVAELPVEIPESDRHARHQLVLKVRGVLPVVAALEPALLDVRRRHRGEIRQTEVRIAGRSQLAHLDDEIAVGIGPGARVGGGAGEGTTGNRAAERIELAREADRLALDVAAQAGLERGLAVAEHVPGEADARPEILPARKVRLLVK